jgi:probable phosphomutase (TIGR03848 family)
VARPSPTKRQRPTLVLFVRHGKTPTTGRDLPGRSAGLHLAADGVTQAEQVAARIGELGRDRVAAVYASPLERTQETAAPIARACGLRVRSHEGLLELDVGDWSGRRLRDLQRLKAWRTVQRYPSGFRFPGGESFPEMQTRIVSTTADLVRRHPGTTVVCVSHADPIRALVAHAMGTHLDLFQRIVVSPCSITAIAFGAEGPVVLTVNSVGGPLTDLAAA